MVVRVACFHGCSWGDARLGLCVCVCLCLVYCRDSEWAGQRLFGWLSTPASQTTWKVTWKPDFCMHTTGQEELVWIIGEYKPCRFNRRWNAPHLHDMYATRGPGVRMCAWFAAVYQVATFGASRVRFSPCPVLHAARCLC